MSSGTTSQTNPSILAVFIDLDAAHQAAGELYHAGFRRMWLAQSAGDEVSEKLSRHDCFVEHGVSEERVRAIEASLERGNVVLAVRCDGSLAEAVEIITECGGRCEGTAAVAEWYALPLDRVRVPSDAALG